MWLVATILDSVDTEHFVIVESLIKQQWLDNISTGMSCGPEILLLNLNICLSSGFPKNMP